MKTLLAFILLASAVFAAEPPKKESRFDELRRLHESGKMSTLELMRRLELEEASNERLRKQLRHMESVAFALEKQLRDLDERIARAFRAGQKNPPKKGSP